MFGQAVLVLGFRQSDHRSNLVGNRIKWLILQGFKELILGAKVEKSRGGMGSLFNFRIMKRVIVLYWEGTTSTFLPICE